MFTLLLLSSSATSHILCTGFLSGDDWSRQVAQLSLTNPRNVLHHGKQSRDRNHALLWVICHHVVRTDIAYVRTNFDGRL